MRDRNIVLILGFMICVVIAFAVFGERKISDNREWLREKLRNAKGITYDPNSLTFKIIEQNEPERRFVSFTIDRDFPILNSRVPIPVYEYEDGSRLNLYRELNEPNDPNVKIFWIEPGDPNSLTFSDIERIYKKE